MSWSYNPNFAETKLVWAVPRSLATTYGITIVLFSSRYLDVSVPWVSLQYNWITVLRRLGCPIRIFADQFVFANPRNFSQLITSFIAYESQGIPRTPLLTFSLYKFYTFIFKVECTSHSIFPNMSKNFITCRKK